MTLATRTSPRDAERKRDLERKRRVRSETRDIGTIPPIEDVKRRIKAEKSFRFFCETYFPERFYLEWGQHHLDLIDKIQHGVGSGGKSVYALPRGDGKTTISKAGVLWATLTARSRYAVLLGATKGKAEQLIRDIKADLMFTDLLLADFPGVVFPIQCLQNQARRAEMQTHHGIQTRIRWLTEQVVFPTVPGEPASGAILDVASITGDIRGKSVRGPNGEMIRPDLVICDDVQTLESAYSPAQCAQRLRAIHQDVKGLAGRGKSITVLIPCTVICEGDVADTLLDSEQTPAYTSIRTKMLLKWPDNTELWEEYARIWARTRGAKKKNSREATKFYRSNRKAMDKGAEVTWKHGYRRDEGEISAIQYAYNLFLEDPEGFYAEYQNQPRGPQTAIGLSALTAKELARRTNGEEPGVAPPGFDLITSAIDVQGDVLFWMVCAWRRDDFSGAIIDYGATPPQTKRYFTLRDVGRTIVSEHPDLGYEAALHFELEQLTNAIAAKQWRGADGVENSLALGLVDANWARSTDIVNNVARRSRGKFIPSHGRGITAAKTPISDFQDKAGERLGEEWIIRPSKRGRIPIRHVMPDANYWKSFVHARLSTPINDPGAITLYQAMPADHRMLADHLVAEVPTRTSNKASGREVDEWALRPKRPDNHWWDTLYMNAVAASIMGATLGGAVAKKRKVKRVRYSDIQAKKKRGNS